MQIMRVRVKISIVVESRNGPWFKQRYLLFIHFESRCRGDGGIRYRHIAVELDGGSGSMRHYNGSDLRLSWGGSKTTFLVI
jgi:hypothetical protein